MFDWTALTKDPTDKTVSLRFQEFLTSLQSFYTASRQDFLRDYFRGHRVLDIGAGEHDPSYYHADKWEHGIIAKAASYAVGVEINADLCEHYNNKGYKFHCVDATSPTDLGERFDRVFMGDVIEHVDNPVLLLQFAKRHLDPAGGDRRILVSTPNPFYFGGMVSRLRKKNRPYFIANFEHTSWITPTNANELARRAGLRLTKIYFPDSFSATSLKNLIRTGREKLMRALSMTECAHKEYIYEFSV